MNHSIFTILQPIDGYFKRVLLESTQSKPNSTKPKNVGWFTINISETLDRNQLKMEL